MRRKLVLVATCMAVLFAPRAAARPATSAALHGSFSIFGSYSVATIKTAQRQPAHYEVASIHALVPLVSWTSRFGGIEVAEELFAGRVMRPAPDTEIGLPLMIRYWSPPWRELRVQAYVEGGAGPAYFSRMFEEESTHLNFADLAGAGLVWQLGNGLALRSGYRIRHVSNGGFSKPNRGVDGHFALMGVIIGG